MKKMLYTFVVILMTLPALSQIRKVSVIGSSTAAGSGVSHYDSSWVRRLIYYYTTQLGILNATYNLGVGGTFVYNGMPTSYTPPANRPSPDVTHNVTQAVSLLSGVSTPANGIVIVNYPSNGYVEYSISEVMNCLRMIYDSAVRTGNRCYITTTQPRTDGSFGTSAIKRKLADIKDSILLQFGNAAINFWDDMYNPADTTIKTEYSAGDNIHFNNAGHRILFEKVVAKDIFGLNPLPLVWGDFITLLNGNQVKLQWSTLQEDNTTHFIVEHSPDGKKYAAIASIPAKGNSNTTTNYVFNHVPTNTEGLNFYRVKQIDANGQVSWSAMRIVQFRHHKVVVVRLSPNPVRDMLQANVLVSDINIVIVDASGRMLRKIMLPPGFHNINLQPLPAGSYHILIHKNRELIDKQAIIKL